MSNIRPYLGRFPQIADDVWVDRTAVVIGKVAIGPRSSVWPTCVLRGDVNDIRIGRETNIQDGSILHVSHDRLGPALAIGESRITFTFEIRDKAHLKKICRELRRQGFRVKMHSLVPRRRKFTSSL